MKIKNNNSRRDFLKNIFIGSRWFFYCTKTCAGRGFVAPSDKLNIAGIGAGGKGESDLFEFSKSPNANIAFLCDVDDRQIKKSLSRFPNAKRYFDFREMLDKEHQSIDAVSVSIPDNCHAVAAVAAMQLGKHVYVQKPLTHDIYEARMLTESAKRYKVVTQMGNQGASGDGVRTMQEWYRAGLIGDAKEIKVWTNRPVWPQGPGHRKALILYHRSSNGIFGLALQKKQTTIRNMFLSAGVVSGHLAQVHWAIWVVT